MSYRSSGIELKCTLADWYVVMIAPPSLLAAEPAARPFDMGGRQMRGWVLVAGASLSDDELDRWVGRCRSYVETLPAKQPGG